MPETTVAERSYFANRDVSGDYTVATATLGVPKGVAKPWPHLPLEQCLGDSVWVES